jgi:hypothetical protein
MYDIYNLNIFTLPTKATVLAGLHFSERTVQVKSQRKSFYLPHLSPFYSLFSFTYPLSPIFYSVFLSFFLLIYPSSFYILNLRHTFPIRLISSFSLLLVSYFSHRFSCPFHYAPSFSVIEFGRW